MSNAEWQEVFNKAFDAKETINKEQQKNVDTFVDMIAGNSEFETTIILENEHKYTVNINGKWYGMTPHVRTYTQEETDDPSILEREYELVKKLAYEEFEQRK